MDINELIEEMDPTPAPPPTPELQDENSVVAIPAEDLAAALRQRTYLDAIFGRFQAVMAYAGNLNISQKWEKFKKFVYDPQTRKIFGRTVAGWSKLALFYGIFYGILVAIFAIGMQVLLRNLNNRVPTLKFGENLIGTSPGLGFRPIDYEDGALIRYNLNNLQSSNKWIKMMDNFLKPYKVLQNKENVKKCTYKNRSDNDTVCLFDLKQFGQCGKDYEYGYRSSSPCVFIKLNKILSWIPKSYTKPHKDMPQELNETIWATPEKLRDQVWITCKGETSKDEKNFSQFIYFPLMGFPSYFYPYMNTKNYLSPLIAVRILNVKPNVLINFECRAWAKNIVYKRTKNDCQGCVHFEIYIEK